MPTLTGVGDSSGMAITMSGEYYVLRYVQTTNFQEIINNSDKSSIINRNYRRTFNQI